ncbi:MAG: hypothetical protein KDI55_00360 [Anaerolineae bacterium]|nr:hypothetical protein [Anaerolineae bacterium]
MSMMMFLAWFDGMQANIEDAPTPKQWAAIVSKIEDLRSSQGQRQAADFNMMPPSEATYPPPPEPYQRSYERQTMPQEQPARRQISDEAAKKLAGGLPAAVYDEYGVSPADIAPPTGRVTGIEPNREPKPRRVPTNRKEWRGIMLDAAETTGVDRQTALEEWRDGEPTDPEVNMAEDPEDYGRRLGRSIMNGTGGGAIS